MALARDELVPEWTLHRSLPPSPAFTDPGYAKIAFSIRVELYGTRRTLVIAETRTATTDARSRRRFAVYYS